jgi:hypothetical protein
MRVTFTNSTIRWPAISPGGVEMAAVKGTPTTLCIRKIPIPKGLIAAIQLTPPALSFESSGPHDRHN